MQSFSFRLPQSILAACLISTALAYPSRAPAQDAQAGQGQAIVYVTVTQIDAKVGAEMASSFRSAVELREQIEQLAQDGFLNRSAVVRLRTQTGAPAEVLSSGLVAQTVGTNTSRTGTVSRQTRISEIGTSLRITTALQGQNVVGEFKYASSYTLKPSKEAETPGIETIQSSVTAMAQLGEVVMLHSQTIDGNSVYLYAQFSAPSGSRPKATTGTRARLSTRVGERKADSTPERSAEDRSRSRYLAYVNSTFKRFDKDGNGLLDKEELKVSPLKRYLATHDANADGKLSPEEAVDAILKR